MDFINEIVDDCIDKQNIQIVDVEKYNDIDFEKFSNIVTKYIIKITVDKQSFEESILSLYLDYSNNGKSDTKIGRILYSDFLDITQNNETKYIFHNILSNKNIFEAIKKHIPLPNNSENKIMRVSRFYSGYKYSGSNIHLHTKAINYLISGKKIWIIFPNSEKNIKWIVQHNLHYIKSSKLPIEWLSEYYHLLKTEIENEIITIQNEGEAIYVPDYYFHGVVNLEKSYGITYSWL
jgi:hypothetical protein